MYSSGFSKEGVCHESLKTEKEDFMLREWGGGEEKAKSEAA